MNILSIEDLGDETIRRILTRSQHWLAQNRDVVHTTDGPLKGRIVLNLFYENSTRTLMSFSTAALKLSGEVISLPVAQSSVQKGETLEDTAHTLCAMKPDVLVIRHPENGAAARIAPIMRCPVINAGDGTNEHPTQALLDAVTLMDRFGRIEGLKIAICGDIKHSRVARSDAKLFERLGAEVRLAGPPELLPQDRATCSSIDEAIEGADVVMMLRVQRERLEAELGDKPGEYLQRYGLTMDRLERASAHVAVMHPGPMNRGVEIADAVADDPRSVIWLQVEAGVATRMACLELLAGTRA